MVEDNYFFAAATGLFHRAISFPSGQNNPIIRRMFDPVTIDAQVDRLGRVAASMDMIAVKRGHSAATGTASGRASACAGDAVRAHESAAAKHKRGGMKLAAILALGQHQAASVT
jgi:hypothetical protein